MVAEQIKALKFSKTDFEGGRLKCTSVRIFICQWEKRKNFILTFTAILLLSIPNFWLAIIVHRVATLDTSFFPCFTASTISCSHKQFKWVKPTCTSRTTFGNLVSRKLNNYWLVCNQPKQAAFPVSIPNLHCCMKCPQILREKNFV